MTKNERQQIKDAIILQEVMITTGRKHSPESKRQIYDALRLVKNLNLPVVSKGEAEAVCKAPSRILPCSHFYSNRCLHPHHCNFKQTDC